MLTAIATIAYRDFVKFLRDRRRLLFSMVFPAIFIGVLGNSFESNLGDALPFNYLAFTFTGVVAQVMFQSTASGVISLVEDRETDFAQEMFIAPVSRITIVFGKIIGESMVALVQGAVVLILGILMGVEISLPVIIQMIPGVIVAALVGGAFGVLVLANLSDQKSANQLFPLLIFPQYFLSGVFSPVQELPGILLVLSRIAPLTYVVDMLRHLFWFGDETIRPLVTINSLGVNLIVLAGMFIVFLLIGTTLFVRNEKNR